MEIWKCLHDNRWEEQQSLFWEIWKRIITKRDISKYHRNAQTLTIPQVKWKPECHTHFQVRRDEGAWVQPGSERTGGLVPDHRGAGEQVVLAHQQHPPQLQELHRGQPAHAETGGGEADRDGLQPHQGLRHQPGQHFETRALQHLYGRHSR